MNIKNELRFGNLFLDDQNEILSIDLYDGIEETVSANGMKNILIADLIPIPLTDYWLKRLGAKLENRGGYEKEFLIISERNTLFLRENKRDKSSYYYGDYKIEFVHQLQNISIDLLKKELTLIINDKR